MDAGWKISHDEKILDFIVMRKLTLILSTLLLSTSSFWFAMPALGDDETDFDKAFEIDFDDAPRVREIIYPEWFKDSFLDLREDLKEAREAGKKGIALYFGQDNCAYCKALIDNNFNKPDLVKYVRENFDIIPLDIWGSRVLTLPDGSQVSEKDLAVRLNTNFTPSLVFIDQNGNIIYKMRGYYKPYRFLAMMHYLVEGFYKKESFRDYLARADPPPRFDDDELNEMPQALPGPVILDRRASDGQKPLIVLFEQPRCHACDQLHSAPLLNGGSQKLLENFEVRQLNAWSNKPLITPQGEMMTVRQWADKLNIHYLPTMVFFDRKGREIDRIDSVIKLYRLRNMMEYVLSKGYQNFRSYQHWRRYTPFN